MPDVRADHGGAHRGAACVVSDRADQRAELDAAERHERFNAQHWRAQAMKVRAALHLYAGAAREELAIVAAEHEVAAAVAMAKASGLRAAALAESDKEQCAIDESVGEGA